MSIIINKLDEFAMTLLAGTLLEFVFFGVQLAEDPKVDPHNSLIITNVFLEGKKYVRHVQCCEGVLLQRRFEGLGSEPEDGFFS